MGAWAGEYNLKCVFNGFSFIPTPRHSPPQPISECGQSRWTGLAAANAPLGLAWEKSGWNPLSSVLARSAALAFHADRLTLSRPQGADRRAALFRESLVAMAERWTFGLAWALSPKRIGGLPNLFRLCFDELLAPDYALPDPEQHASNPPGLAGIVHEFTLPTLLAAYRRGLYPWAHIAPLKWWSPPQRSVLLFKDFHISNNLRRLDAARPLHRDIRPRFRRRDRRLRRTPQRPLASHLDHAAGHARLR